MATYATYRHIELDKVGYSKKRVRNPSSEILNVLYSPSSPDKGSRGFGGQRRSSHNDSFSRLFGTPDGKKPSPRRASLSKHDITNRNPVTGDGVTSFDCRPTNRNTPRIHTERNPVTGETYQIVSPATTPTKTEQNSISHQNGISSAQKSSSPKRRLSLSEEKRVHASNDISGNE